MTAAVDSDYYVELLMPYLKHSINPAGLVCDETLIRFHFTDTQQFADWWFTVKQGIIDAVRKGSG